MLHTNQDSFLSELSKIFESGRQKKKSVWVTMKRYDGRTTRNPRKPNDKPKKNSKSSVSLQRTTAAVPAQYKCLIRARIGNKKISTAIAQKEINKFQQSYSNLIKGNIYGLKKAAHSGRGGPSGDPYSEQHQPQRDDAEKKGKITGT